MKPGTAAAATRLLTSANAYGMIDTDTTASTYAGLGRWRHRMADAKPDDVAWLEELHEAVDRAAPGFLTQRWQQQDPVAIGRSAWAVQA